MTARIVYTDLDGTMVGPGGSFFRTDDRELTDTPARALLDLHRAGVTLVLVSGRTRLQLMEAAGIFGADGFIGELGAVVGWDHGRSHTVLPGETPAGYAGRTPIEVLAELGLPQALFAAWPGRLEWHAPWHAGHEADAMIRGLVDLDEVHRWLGRRGLDWVRLRDNGVLAGREWPGLVREAWPPHVYHLMPAGLSKGEGVAWDLRRRGLTPADAIAIGDSASDLEMAPHVREMWVVANGAAAPHMAPLLAERPNVRVAAGAVGLGWAEAVRAGALGEDVPGGLSG